MSARYSRCRSAQLGDCWQARATQRSERARQRPSARRVGGRPVRAFARSAVSVKSSKESSKVHACARIGTNYEKLQ